MFYKLVYYVIAIVLLLAALVGGIVANIVCAALAVAYLAVAMVIDHKDESEQKVFDDAINDIASKL